MKQDFDAIVRENTDWLLAYVRQSVRQIDVAEDLVQEIFIKAFRAYDGYEESGRIRAWLRAIARNTLRNYYATPETAHISLSLDVETGEDEDESLYHIIPDGGPTPEEALIRKELVDNVMRVLASMPPPQRMVLTYRFIDGLTVEQTAVRMGIPRGSVKSSTYYSLQRLRGALGIDPPPRPKKTKTRKGEKIMKCTDAHRYLFQYAMDKLPAGVNADMAAHLETCPACRDIVTALRNLIPHLPAGRVGELTHYNIDFPSIDICYSSIGKNLINSERLNEILAENNGCVPEGERWWGGGATKEFPILAMFDREGDEIEYVICENKDRPANYRYDVRKLRKVYDPIHWEHTVFADHTDVYKPKASYEAPNLYSGRAGNALGNDANTGIYIALPGNATNIRLKRGNGVIECGPYQFVYAQRYVLENETLWLEYTYNL